jgi:NitT/TauT family transport system permease protein
MSEREKVMKALPWVSTPVLVLIIWGLWEGIIVVTGVSQFVLPRPSEAFGSLVELVQDPATWHHARVTATEAIAGFLIAVVTGVVVGAVLGRVVWLERSLRPAIVALQVLPKVALVPLMIIWFGFGLTSKIIIAAILAFFPIMLNVLLGVRSVDTGQRDVMRSLNAGRWQTFRHLEFPSTMPYVLAGMEVGIVLAVIGAIVGEYLGGSEGLGYLVVVTLNQLNAPDLFAVIIMLAALGSVLFFFVNGLKRLFIPWHESVTAETGEAG